MICLMVIILNGGGGGGGREERKGKTELSYDPPLPKVTKTGFLTTIPKCLFKPEGKEK